MKTLKNITEGLFDADDSLESFGDEAAYSELKEKLKHKYHEAWKAEFLKYFGCTKPIDVAFVERGDDVIIEYGQHMLFMFWETDCSIAYLNDIEVPDLWPNNKDILRNIDNSKYLDKKYYQASNWKYDAYKLDKEQVKKAISILNGWAEVEGISPRKHICAKIRKLNKIVNK